MESPYKLNTMRYRASRTRFKQNHKSELNSLVKISKHFITWSTCISEQSHRQNDAAVSPAGLAALHGVRSDESRPQRGRLGSPNHIKESIKIKPRGTGLSYHVIWCGVQRGDPASWTQYNRHPIWTGPTARICSDNVISFEYCIIIIIGERK